MIETLREYSGKNIKVALFDFDGTLSLERDGWIDLIVDTFVDELVKASDITKAKALEWCLVYIQGTIGIPTYLQAEGLANKITSLGVKAENPQVYKDKYNQKLVELVNNRRKTIPPEKLRVKGSLELVELLAKKLGKENLYLASGSDIDAVLESIKFLGFERFFSEENIVGAGSNHDPRVCAKEYVIDELVRRRGLKPGELLCFGDGFPELSYTCKVGGISVGVLTNDVTLNYPDYFTISKKRERLIMAGAHILVPDFGEASKLVKALNI